MKQLYQSLTLVLLLAIMAGKTNAQVTVDATAGTTTASYTTLKGAFDAINLGTHQGVIDIRIHANTTELASAALNASGTGSASYTSVLVRPADTATVVKQIATTASGFVLVSLDGADNITFDGRPMGAGTSRLLEINSMTSATTNITFRHNIGATNVLLTYMRIFNAGAAATAGGNIQYTNSVASTGPNSNNTMSNCLVSGGRNAIIFDGTNATSNMTGILLSHNEVVDFGLAGINVGNNVGQITIDSNSIYHNASFTSTLATRGIAIAGTSNQILATVTKNRIYGLKTSSTSIFGMLITPTAAAGNNYDIINNSIALMEPNNSVNAGAIGGVCGMVVQGTGSGTENIFNNTVRVGGTCVGGPASGSFVRSVAFGKFNSGTANSLTLANNIFSNERLGGTLVSGFSEHMAVWINTNTAGTHVIDINSYFSLSTFIAGWGGTVYGTLAGYQGAAAPNEASSVFKATSFTNTTDPYLSGTSVGDLDLIAAPIGGITSDIDNNLRSISFPYKGAFESQAFPVNDAAVLEIYTLGKLPIPYAIPHTVRAAVAAIGLADTLFNVKVKLSIAGANAYLDSTYIDTLLRNTYKIVSFPNPVFYANLGSGTVTVSVDDDDYASNNSKTVAQNITTGTYAYADPTLPADGGVGFNGVGGDFVAKFPYSGSNSINQVGVNFNTGGQPFQIVIYDMVNDTPGTLLWNSSTATSVTGVNTVSVNPPVAVSGTFFVGVRQTGTVNVGFGYQTEDPIRDLTFYYKATTVPAWSDFAVTNSAFRFMVEPRLQIADDIGAQSVSQPCDVVAQSSPPIMPQVKVFNYGINTQTSLIVQSSITGPVSYSSSDTFSSISLVSNTEMSFMLGTAFNPTTAGTYTMKVWTLLGADLEPNNDTITYVFDVININLATDAGNNIDLNGTNQSLTVGDNASLDFTGSMMTLESWVKWSSFGGDRYIFSKEQSGGATKYDLYINSAGNLVFKLQTLSGTDSVVSTKSLTLLTYSHVAATYDGLEMKLYINGDTAGLKSMIGNMMTSNTSLTIGSHFSNTGFLGASLDEVRVWDTARTEMQIRAGLHTRMANFANPYLKAYYRFDESGVPVFTADASGNCNSALINGGATLSASTIPLGAPVVSMQNISASGSTPIANVYLAVNAYNQAGANDYYVHLFPGQPIGTLPSTAPGGVTDVHQKNWIIYRYGAGTMDSAEVDFTVTSILPTTLTTDVQLFTRGVGENGGWVNTRSEAFSVNSTTQIVAMNLGSAEFNKQFALGGNNGALPVELLHFTGRSSGGDVILKWATSSEQNNDGFVVERSVDGKKYTKVTFVKGKGNSMLVTNYGTTDAKAFATTGSTTLYYRLVQTDFSGKTTYSNVVRVTSDKVTSSEVSVYPNPFNSEVSLSADIAQAGQAKIVVVDITGHKVLDMTTAVESGVQTIETKGLEQLPKGVYMLELTINGELSTHKLLKQ